MKYEKGKGGMIDGPPGADIPKGLNSGEVIVSTNSKLFRSITSTRVLSIHAWDNSPISVEDLLPKIEGTLAQAMTRQQRRKQEREAAKSAAAMPKEAINLARQDAIRQMCQGEFDTPYHRALAECFLDYKEGKITKEKYEELTKMKG